MRFFDRAVMVCTMALAWAGSPALGDGEATVETLPSLASVAWAGPTPDPTFLEGKTVVVFTFVTWCPKCNAWTGAVVSEIKKEAEDKPVVILAISTDTPPAGALAYMKERGFVGPNIFHGTDPSIATRFGFSNQFVNYAIVGPDGKIASSGNGGRRYADDKKPAYVSARYLAETQNLGRLRLVKADMPAAVKERLWLLELGLTRDVKKLEAGLAPAERDQVQAAIRGMLASEIERVDRLSKGDSLTDKLSAADGATYLVANFATSPEGRRAKEVLASFAKDKPLQDELSAKRQYEAAMKVTNSGRQAKALEAIIKKFPDTEFGKKAAETIKQGV